MGYTLYLCLYINDCSRIFQVNTIEDDVELLIILDEEEVDVDTELYFK